jgi:autotransporter-associated beta strand protein
VVVLTFGASRSALSQTITKNSTSSGTLSAGSEWTGGTAPSGSSIALWTNNIGGGTFTLGANVTWGEIQIANPNNPVIINSGSILTLNGVSGIGIDMSGATQNLTLNPSLVLGGAQAWNVGSGRTLTIGGTVNNGGNLLTLAGPGLVTMNGVISGAGGLTMNGTGTLTLTAANTYTGVTTINNGTLELDFTAGSAPNTDIIKNGTTLALGGGTLYAHGAKGTANDQTFGGLTLNPGDSEVIADSSNGSHPSTSFDFGAITRTIGSTVDFTLPSSGTFATSTGNANFSGGQATILGGYATVGGSDWAAIGGGTIGALSSYTSTFIAGKDVSTAAGTFAPGALTINSLRFNSSGSYTINTGGNLTIATGGILETTTVGANGVSINNNSLTSGNGLDLIVIQNNTSGSLTVGSTITDNGTTSIGLTKAGVGTLALTGSNTYSGTTTINEGALQVGNGSTSGTLGTGSVTNNSALVFNRSDTVTYSGSIAGSGTLSQSGTGTLVLDGNSTYTGSTLINSGTLQVGSGGTSGSLGTSLVTNSSILAFDRSDTVNYGGVIAGSGSLVQSGSGTLVLSANNTFTGSVNFNNGLIQASTLNNLGSGTALIFNGGGLQFNGIFDPSTRTMTFNSGGATLDTQGNNITLANAIGNSGVGGLTKLGSGALTLSADETYTGVTTINAGTVNLGAASGNVLAGNVVISGGVLAYSTAVNEQIADTASVTLNSGAFLLGARTETINGLLMSGGSLTIGSGKLVLNNASTISGGTASITANSGVLQANANLTLNGGTIDLSGSTSAGATMNLRGGTGTGIIYQNTATAGATIQNGNVSLNTAAGAQTVFDIADAPTVGTELTINSALTGGASGGLLKQGTGVLLLGGSTANTYSGLTTVNAGELDLNKTAGVNAIGGSLTIAGGSVKLLASEQIGNAAVVAVNGGSFNLNGNNETVASTTIGSGGLLTNGVSGATLSGGLSNNGTVFVSQNTFFNGPVTNTGAFLWQGAISNNYVQSAGTNALNGAATITQNATVNGGIFNLNGQIYSNGQMIVNGTGILTNAIAGATFNGGLSNAATVAVTADTFFNGPVTNTGAFFFQGTFSNALVNSGSFNLNNNATLTSAPVNSGTINVASSKLTVVPDWANAGSLQISGGTLTGGTVTNLSGRGFSGFGTVSNLVVNQGTMTATGGTLTLVVAPVNNGTTIVANASALNVLPAWTNSGVLSNAPTGAVSGGTLTNTGTINGGGFINPLVVNQGRMDFGGTISNNLLQTAGSFTVSSSATITGTATVNGGTFNLNGGTYSNGLMIVSGTGVLTNAIAGATFNGGLSNATTVGITANTFFNGPVTNTGTFSLLGAVSNTLANSGNVILNGSGTVSTLVNNGSVNVNSGTLSLLAAPTQNGSITVANGATVNAAQAWVNNGTITLLGGSITNAAITNNLFISGFGTIDGSGVVNNGKLFADASSISGVGTETVRIASFTNNVSATIGTASSNAVLNLLTTGNTLINRGTISLSGGTILFNGGAGTITNFNIIAGVGNVANFPIVNAGTLASFIAQAPISGLSNLIATIGVTNSGLLGANNFINGAATLSLTVSGGGAAIVNQGTVALQGGFLTVNGGAGVITNITNGLIYGTGTQTLSVANLSGGTILASNGVFSLGLQGNANAGLLSNANAASTISLTNSTLVNNGTVVLNSGGFLLNGTVTNEGTIYGSGAFVSSVYNDTTGLISATGGVLNVATNLGETVSNFGLINISTSGTLNVVPSWVNTNGTVSLLGGGLTGGALTNAGTITGFGTISSQIVNTSGGTLNVASAGSLTLVDAPVQGGWINIPNTSTLNVLQAWLNSGTVNIQGGTLVGSTITNAATITGFGTITPLVRNNGGATFTVTGGTMTLVIAPTQIGTFVITNGGTLNVLAAWQNSGTVNLLGGDIIGSTVTNAGTMTGFGGVQNLVNNGGIFVTNGTLRATASFTQNNTVDIAANSRLDVTPTWSNNGSVLINGGFISGGTMNNTASGLLRGFGTVSNSVANLGTIVATNGTLKLVNTLTQSGTITIANAATFNMAQAWQNNGLVNILGGTLAGATVTNAATISGSGVIAAVLSNTGYLRATNGYLYAQTLAGNQAAGILEASAGATLAVNGSTPWSNNGQLTLSGGTVVGGDISNNATHLITGAGTINVNVYNSGSIVANNAGQVLTLNDSLVNLASGVVAANTGNLVVNGSFTNAGTLNMIHSVGTFSGAVVNSGAWITDPTINVFQNTYTVTSSGYIQSSPGDVYIFSNNATTASSFINISTNKNQFDTLGGDFVFANTLGATQQFAAAGHDFGPGTASATNTAPTTVNPLTLAAYSNNFALGTLQISDSTTVEVTDAFSLLGPGTNDGLDAALYLDNLYIGSNSLLLIAGNVQLYFINSNNWSMANIELEGNPGLDNSISGIHQFAVIPEPSVVLLWLCGFATIYAARRRWKIAGRNFRS